MKQNDRAGKPAEPSDLIDVNALIKAYYSNIPDPSRLEQKVVFGTSGHRGSSFDSSFNERHILAITQSICDYRKENKIDGPLFIGIDTHALSKPALQSALEVLCANGVTVKIAENNEYTPTPVISHAILTYNKGKTTHLSDGIVVTPSHNPPREGGFKYNPPNGGPADPNITNWVQAKANSYLGAQFGQIKRMPVDQATTIQPHNYMKAYVDDLCNVIDMDAIKRANISIGVDPMGGASVHYWKAIKEKYGINLTVTNEIVDPTFKFMTLDWDGQIRMDPSSPFAMEKLIQLRSKFDIAFSCDTDADRHGIVTKSSGLLQPNHYLSVAIWYLFQNRKNWKREAMVGKTVVSSQMIDRVTKKIGRELYEVPVGFKWFVDGLYKGFLAFGGEESAGASFSRLDGSVWTTDKDGIIPCLLAAEITAKIKKDPGQIYKELTDSFGISYFIRYEGPCSMEQKKILKSLSPEDIHSTELAGEKIEKIYTRVPGNDEPIGGMKVITENGSFSARPSGTEDIYRIYIESFKSKEHMMQILEEAKKIVDEVLNQLPAATRR